MDLGQDALRRRRCAPRLPASSPLPPLLASPRRSPFPSPPPDPVADPHSSSRPFAGLKQQRLDTPLLRKDGKLTPVGWPEALEAAAGRIGAAGGAVGAFAGPLVSVEALACAKQLLNMLGSTTTKACTDLSADLRAGYTLNTTLVGIEHADALLLVGTNPRVEAPLLNVRLRRMAIKGGVPIARVGKASDLTYDVTQLGETADALKALADGSSPFAATLAAAERPAVLVGTGALNDGGVYGPAVEALARKVAADAGALTDEWNGYAVLQPTSAATGALDVGFVPGPTALPLSKLKVVYLLGEDGLALHDMASDAFVVYQGHHGDAGAESADLVLPAAAYTEQSGTYVNTEGRVQRAARAADPPGDAREDWAIVCALAATLNVPLPYGSLADVRVRLGELAPHLALGPSAVEPSSSELAATMLGCQGAAADPLPTAPLDTLITNFYMTDAVSRASATMAKCTKVFGPRV